MVISVHRFTGEHKKHYHKNHRLKRITLKGLNVNRQNFLSN